MTSLRQLASSLGLSAATVSRALAGRSRVAASTRTRILAAAAEAGCGAIRDRDGDGRVLALVQGGFPPDRVTRLWLRGLHEGLGDGAANLGARLVVVPGEALTRAGGDAAALGRLAGCRPSAAVLLGWKDPDGPKRLEQSIPCVGVGGMTASDPSLSVEFDHHAAAEALVGHLHGLGHRRFALVAGGHQPRREAHRIGAVLAALRLHGLDAADLRIIDATALPLDRTVAAALRGRATGWIATGHALTVRTLRVLGRHGIDVPREASVCGFLIDELDEELHLTGVRGPFRAIGRVAATLALGPRDPGRPACRLLLTGSFVAGRTCAPPPASPNGV
jgi:DNA-binding LacI/PurR family transcriptional regulator